jgi:alpha,alpha-trehalase
MAPIEIQNITPLFDDVQMKRVFPDGKTFVDCLPKTSPEEISKSYVEQKDRPGFNLERFVLSNFELPVSHSREYHTDASRSVTEHINKLWGVLTREPDHVGGSLLSLPNSYIVPGGRFGEIYYWDSYFTMLGLKVSGKFEMLENMVDNFSYLIDTIGYIPNGNRSYFIGRSQPPFYSLMITLLADIKGNETLVKYLPQIEKEYQFWMKGREGLNETTLSLHRVVKMPQGEILNRYWDENDSPRPESYREDVELAHESEQDPKSLYRHLRAGAESGWDFSGRWFKDIDKFASIHTCDIIPIDLNSLLVHLEQTIVSSAKNAGHSKVLLEW